LVDLARTGHDLALGRRRAHANRASSGHRVVLRRQDG
jgi:hypothetical protein